MYKRQPVTLSTPCAAPEIPLNIFPPPITIETSTPRDVYKRQELKLL